MSELKTDDSSQKKPQIEAKNMSCYSLPNLYNAPDCLTFGGILAGTHIDFPLPADHSSSISNPCFSALI